MAAAHFAAKLRHETDPADVAAARAAGETPLVIDVRSAAAWDQGHIPGAMHLPGGELLARLGELPPAHEDPQIVVYCWGPGCNGSTKAALTLAEAGYANVREMIGGYEYWAREGLAIEVGTSLPGSRVVALLDQLVAIHGAPRAIRCDNGPELISEALRDWAERRGVALHFIQPGKPNQNAYIERFNRTYRREVLDACLFASLADVRAETAAWLTTYNTERPHDSLGDLPPLTFLPRHTTPAQSSYELSG